MANIDIPIKRLMQTRIEDWIEFLIPNCDKDWVKFLIPNCDKDWVKEMDTTKVPAKKESRLDKLILIDAPEERFILNIEPQGYLDYKMPARMLRYRSDIWEYTIELGMGTPSIKQAVVYFYKSHDNKQYSLEDNWGDENTLHYSYRAIKVWEMKREYIIEKKLLGLYPLIPLTDKIESESDEEVIENTIIAIKTVENPALQADLLAVMSILAGEKFSSELVKKFVRREMLMNSPLFNEWVEEERKEAVERAQIETTKKNILSLLSEKFDFVPKDIRESVSSIEDLAVLDELHKKIIKLDTIEAFQNLLEKVKP